MADIKNVLDIYRQYHSQLLEGVFSGDIDPSNLDQAYYQGLAAFLYEAVEKGFGESLDAIKFGSADYELLEELRSNIYRFSAAKEFQMTLEMSNALVDSEGNLLSQKDFRELATDIFVKYNGGIEPEGQELRGWLDTERNTAITQAGNAAKWNTIQKQKEQLPYLRYVTESDELVCDICDPLDGICLPVDDPFWDEYYPAQHFSCRCLVEQLDQDDGEAVESEDDDVDAAKEESKITDEFKYNAGMKGEIFSSEGFSQHPYFSVPQEYEELAKNNFNLPLPEQTIMDGAISDLMEKAKESGPEVQSLAEKIADKRGADVSKINFKKAVSIKRKATDEYEGNLGSIKDSVRNTIIADERLIPSILKDYKEETVNVTINRQYAESNALGYSGNIINLKTKNGLFAETQVNTAKMIYAKDENALSILGEEKFNAIKKETRMESGLGHKYYEEWRKITKEQIEKHPQLLARKLQLEKISQAYYSHFY